MLTSNYKNKQSIVLENENLRAEFLPEPGGKMVSLRNKKNGFEFLVQRPNELYRDKQYGSSYVEGECSGYDDMFPTIDTCTCEQEPWNGVEMPDHGEVWSLPWNYEQEGEGVRMFVKGVRFPYTLEKRMLFTSRDTLRIEYVLKSQSDFDFDFLWAGHFMFNIDEGTQVVVPDDCKEMISILSNGGRQNGDVNEWPWLLDSNKKKYRADISRAPEAKGFEKYYFKDRLSEGWCRLIYPDQKNILEVKFPVATVPYLGILMNENGWNELYNIFIEPCTVCYDRPDIAKKYGQVSSLPAAGNYKWFVDITIK
jgi:hypothetical protein